MGGHYRYRQFQHSVKKILYRIVSQLLKIFLYRPSLVFLLVVQARNKGLFVLWFDAFMHVVLQVESVTGQIQKNELVAPVKKLLWSVNSKELKNPTVQSLPPKECELNYIKCLLILSRCKL